MPILMLLLFLLLPIGAQAQTPTSPPASPPAATPSEGVLKSEQLDALVAPIALYPDTLLAQVLMASTYPLEIVQAERWIAENKGLKEDALKAALAKQPWDDSVKALIPTPSVLVMMSKKLDWTQKLGDAVLAQETEVMDSVQRLRARAQATDKLQSSKEQKVTAKVEGGRQTIAIESADPSTVYVPYYDPAVVYGTWPYPDYPPDYYYPDDYYLPGGIIATGIAFGAGYAWWRWASGGWWGNINWNNRHIDINRGNHVEHWRHNPQHRRGVAYNNPKVRQQFAGTTNRPGDRAKGGQPRPAGVAKAGDRAKQAGKAGPKQAAKGNRSAQTKRTAQKGSGQAKRTAQTNRSSQARRTSQQRSGRNVAQHSSRSVARVSRQRSVAPRGGGRSYGGGGRSFGGGGRGGGRGGGGRRSDIRVKHDIALLGRLGNGLGWYRFSYSGGTRPYVGVMAQEVREVAPWAVARGRDGYLTVDYDKLGLRFQTYDEWRARGGHIPSPANMLPASGSAVRQAH